MQAKRSFVHLSLTLILSSSLLAACTSANSPVSGNKVGIGGSQTGLSSNQTSLGGNGLSGTTASSVNVSTLSTELQGITADDATILDAQKVDADFSVMAEREPVTREGGPRPGGPGPLSASGAPASGSPALGGFNPGNPAAGSAAAEHRRFGLQVATQARLDAARKMGKDMAKQHKGELEASGAVKVNDDGSIKIDPSKLKDTVKKNLDEKRSRFEEMIRQNKDKLQSLKASAQNQVQGMRRKNNTVRNSDTVSTTNADGSVTKTRTVEFKNEKTGVSRNLTMSRTTKDNKLVGSEFDLKVTGPNGFTRSVHRVVTVNADGSRSSTTTASTVWGDGRKVERNETRTVGGDSSATGTGTITITQKDGSSKTHTYTLGVSAKGDATVESADSDEAKVTVEDQAGADKATVVVEEKGKEATEESVDSNGDADAGATA